MQSTIEFSKEAFKQSEERNTYVLDFYAYRMRTEFNLVLKELDKSIGSGWTEKCSLFYKWATVNDELDVNMPIVVRHDLLALKKNEHPSTLALRGSVIQDGDVFKAYLYNEDAESLELVADCESMDDAKNVLEILMLSGAQ